MQDFSNNLVHLNPALESYLLWPYSFSPGSAGRMPFWPTAPLYHQVGLCKSGCESCNPGRWLRPGLSWLEPSSSCPEAADTGHWWTRRLCDNAGHCADDPSPCSAWGASPPEGYELRCAFPSPIHGCACIEPIKAKEVNMFNWMSVYMLNMLFNTS